MLILNCWNISQFLYIFDQVNAALVSIWGFCQEQKILQTPNFRKVV